MNNVAPKDRDISMVFQNYALYPHMTVYENMAFALKLRKERRSEIDRKVREAAEILDISDLLKRKPKALSGGQRQRVAIGRAIVRSPQVFLMDEPLSNLDAKLRNQMRAEIIKLRRRIDTTFVYVTHDQTEAMTLGDRIVIMKDGFIKQVGTPYEVFNRPANLFVAGFIGTPQMNFFDASLKRDGDAYLAQIGGRTTPLPEETSALLCERNIPEREVILGVRPEHMVFCPADAPDCVKARIEVSEMMGSVIYLHASLEDGTEIVLAISTMDMAQSGAGDFSAGAMIGFRFENDTVHVFDRQSENNILL